MRFYTRHAVNVLSVTCLPNDPQHVAQTSSYLVAQTSCRPNDCRSLHNTWTMVTSACGYSCFLGYNVVAVYS